MSLPSSISVKWLVSETWEYSGWLWPSQLTVVVWKEQSRKRLCHGLHWTI
jgi:hypothetical protein